MGLEGTAEEAVAVAEERVVTTLAGDLETLYSQPPA
jgi:hypothetical protein